MSFIGLLRTLEQITRPPRMGHDDDRPLPDYEVNCLHRAPHYVIPTGENHQCYCARPQGHPLDDYGYRPHICRCGQLWADLPDKSSASNHTGTGAEPAPSPTIVQSTPPPTVDGEGPSEVSVPPAPFEGLPTSELLTRAADVIDISAAFASALGYCNEATGTDLDVFSAELRDRAATFKAIEE